MPHLENTENAYSVAFFWHISVKQLISLNALSTQDSTCYVWSKEMLLLIIFNEVKSVNTRNISHVKDRKFVFFGPFLVQLDISVLSTEDSNR